MGQLKGGIAQHCTRKMALHPGDSESAVMQQSEALRLLPQGLSTLRWEWGDTKGNGTWEVTATLQAKLGTGFSYSDSEEKRACVGHESYCKSISF